MKVIIGSYRGPEMVNRCMYSLVTHVNGIDKIIIVDDSGNDEWSDYYRNSFGIDVISTHRQGYNNAMKTVCDNAGGQRFMFLEEDFTFTEDVDLNWMELVLIEMPDLAQLALLRGPHFANEKLIAMEKAHDEDDAVLVGLQRRLPDTFIYKRETLLGHEIIVQDGTFTCNPAVWQQGVSSFGWPDGQWSEDKMRDQLLDKGYLFGFVPGIKVDHDGVRSGFNY